MREVFVSFPKISKVITCNRGVIEDGLADPLNIRKFT